MPGELRPVTGQLAAGRSGALEQSRARPQFVMSAIPCCDRERAACNTQRDHEQQSGDPAAPARRRPCSPGRAAAVARARRGVVRLAAALAGLVAIVAYLFVALSRLDYPFALEWLEGNSLVEVHRILAGQPLYPAPTAGYVPDGYPPLYFAVSAAAARVLGRLVPAAAAGLPGVLARLLRAARPPGPARDGQHRGRDRRRGPVRRDLLRHRHLVRRRPGRLAVPRAEHRRPVRRPVDARHRAAPSPRECCSPPRPSPSRPGWPRASR